jgi:hypothetical protein
VQATLSKAKTPVSERVGEVMAYVLWRAGYLTGYLPSQPLVKAALATRFASGSPQTAADYAELIEAHRPFQRGEVLIDDPEGRGGAVATGVAAKARAKREGAVSDSEFLTGTATGKLEGSN